MERENSKSPQKDNQSQNTPKSQSLTKKTLHLRRLQSVDHHFPIENCTTFVLGISGGDCAGKRELIQYMFDENAKKQTSKNSEEPLQVAILHQEYFIKHEDGKAFVAEGTDWESFYRESRNLMIGNEVKLQFMKGGKLVDVHIKPANLLVIQGSHIFMNAEVTHHLSSLINLKIFIDSDSDVRLSRRVYKDTQDYHMDLNDSITKYLEFIKPSYEKEIQPTKQDTDIIIPHFGGGFADHRKQNRNDYSSNIKNACSLILTHLKEEMKKYQEEEVQTL